MARSISRFRNRAVTRGDEEGERVSSNLELIFDLIYVVAVARSVAAFHHELAADHPGHAVVVFATTFFALWWSWMGFTWFANAHDADSVTDRLLTFVQMAGALIIAAGIPQAVDNEDFGVVVVGYLVARVGLVTAWLRVARDQPESRARALRYASGLAAVQVLWVLRVALPDGLLGVSFAVLVVIELAIPVWASFSTGPLPIHTGHIAERYGLFTIILLGESVAAAVGGFELAYDHGGLTPSLVALALCALVLAFGCWWLYFDHPGHLDPTRTTAFRWGYLHLLVFVSLATLGGGLADAFELLSDDVHTSPRTAALAVTLPVAGFLCGLVVLMAVNRVRVADVRILPKLAGTAVIVAGGLTLPPLWAAIVAAATIIVLVTAMVLDEPAAVATEPSAD